MSPESAADLGVGDGDLVRIERAGLALEAPAMRLPGMARGTVSLQLGQGRALEGRIAAGAGDGWRTPLIRSYLLQR